LKAHTAVVFNTSNTPTERENAVFGDPLELLWRKCIFDLCGIKSFHRHMFCVVVTSTEKQRNEWLKQVEEIIIQHFNREPTLV
jgi:putative NADPH-quinone reductase